MRSATYPRLHHRALLEQVLLALLLGFTAFFSITLVLVLGFQVLYLGRIYPGVSVAGVDVGGLSPDDAATRITREVHYPQTGRILLQGRDQSWMVSPSNVGLFLDPENSARQAFAVGRQDGLFQRLSDQYNTWYYGQTLPPTFLFDQRMAYSYLAGLAEQINQPVVETSITIEGTDVLVHPGQSGYRLDIPATLVTLSTQMQTLQDGVVSLSIVENQPAIVDVSEQAELARRILSQPLTLRMPDGQPDQQGPWSFSPEDLATMLTFERINQDDGSARYQVAIRTQTLRSYLANLAENTETAPENARFIFNDDTRQLDLLEPAVIGRSLDIEQSITAIQEKMVQGDHEIPLEFTFTPPPVTDEFTAEQLGITGLLHAETSYFYGSSADRIQNITIAAASFHGLLVAPGETFSMAKALGDISLDNGYAEALIILGGQTIQGVGGGVCQVSTTLFRTAFFSGFPIVERNAHAYRVSYYEKVAGNRVDAQLAGLDAAVFVPLVDFKFTNDTPYWLLMETYVNPSNSSITWKFYSSSDGRQVEWQSSGVQNIVEAPEPEYKEDPELASGEVRQVDWAADGADVTIDRTVLRDGAVYLKDTFQTHYQPWQAVYEYGPGTEGMPPEPTPQDGSGSDVPPDSVP
ncbi:MAG: VanW family protein [Anaerolineaceae bacterium]|nr:VanW family protein [Anaerolineaceae bacterium]